MCVCVCVCVWRLLHTENAHKDARDRALMLWCVSGVTHTYTTHTPPSVTGRLQQQLATPYIFVLYNEPCTYWDAGQYTALHAPHMHMHSKAANPDQAMTAGQCLGRRLHFKDVDTAGLETIGLTRDRSDSVAIRMTSQKFGDVKHA